MAADKGSAAVVTPERTQVAPHNGSGVSVRTSVWRPSGTLSMVEVAQVCGVAQELGSASAEYLTQSERPTAVYTAASCPDEGGTQVNTVVGVYLFMYSGEHRCWCLFVLVRACHLLWCGA